jgi:hypothetical protein
LNAPSSDPNDSYQPPQAFKALVSRNQIGFSGLRQSAREAIHVGRIVFGLQGCSELGEFHIDTDDLNGKLGDLFELLAGFFPRARQTE